MPLGSLLRRLAGRRAREGEDDRERSGYGQLDREEETYDAFMAMGDDDLAADAPAEAITRWLSLFVFCFIWLVFGDWIKALGFESWLAFVPLGATLLLSFVIADLVWRLVPWPVRIVLRLGVRLWPLTVPLILYLVIDIANDRGALSRMAENSRTEPEAERPTPLAFQGSDWKVLHDGQRYASVTWSEAFDACLRSGNGWRMPAKVDFERVEQIADENGLREQFWGEQVNELYVVYMSFRPGAEPHVGKMSRYESLNGEHRERSGHAMCIATGKDDAPSHASLR